MNFLNKKTINKLIKKKLKISVAESCTGGMLSSAITSVPGSSKVFVLGIVSYSNQSKIDILKIPKNIIKKYGAVNEQACLAMLEKLSNISKSNLSVSVTGIAGPGGGTKKKPVGLIYVGIKYADKIRIYKYIFKNKERNYIQKATVKKTLGLIFSYLK